MRICKLSILFFLFPLITYAQNLSGVWIGKLTNDSVTIRKDQAYELALTEYRGKVYGYSHTTFIVNDTLYYIVKRVKGTIENSVCEVKDDEIVSHNFGNKMDKGVKVTHVFRLNTSDSTWHLDGNWQTNATKKYYALTGGVSLKAEKDFAKSLLLQHLGDLQLDNTLTFYKPEKKVYLPAPVKRPISKQDGDIAKTEPGKKQTGLASDKSAISGIEIKNPEIVAINDETEESNLKKPDSTAIALTKPGIENNKNGRSTVTSGEKDIKKITPGTHVDIRSSLPVIKTDSADVTARQSGNDTITSVVAISIPEIKRPDKSSATTVVNEKEKLKADSISAGYTINPVVERRKNIIQTVSYKADSLVLSLYDNGEIDGDTVSVYFNGEMLMEKQGLKGTAIKKTIYLQPGSDQEVEILLFAENLGKYPPNTGLLVIRDGEDRYEIRFSADYDLSPAIILRRKKG